VDGISLTVNRCGRDFFEVAIIPHTLEATTLGVRRKGDQVNIEFDLIGKYVEKLLGPAGGASSGARPAGATIDTAFLAAHDFLK
jgi:riboflavin synthase